MIATSTFDGFGTHEVRGPWVTRVRDLPATVVPLRSHGRLSPNRALPAAGFDLGPLDRRTLQEPVRRHARGRRRARPAVPMHARSPGYQGEHIP
ncbi:hypothetical protein ACIOD2_44745 [Amycolatopsis sp. NPDC088138]|uniref:hypothetical protein n=1 Tax=Amycolatopsis sp. NPDC088138 TaxID=3363938 RepID=UPI003819DADF